MTCTILNIAVPTPLNQLFDYLPSADCDRISAGMRVKISFGRQQLTGMVMALSQHSPLPLSRLKPISQLLDNKPILPEQTLQLCRFASDYYHHPLGEVVAAALPRLLRQGKAATIQQEPAWQLSEQGRAIDLDSLKRAPKQLALIKQLRQQTQPLTRNQLKAAAITNSTLQAVKAKRLIIDCANQIPVVSTPFTPPTLPTLNTAQQQAVTTITTALGKFQPFLLEGITGSGKTEVYLRVIAEVISRDQQALVLVPEISLTPQTIARFQQRFNVPIALLHSRLSDRQRLNNWLLAKTGQAKILIGTRSAIFTPLAQAGIIIIDESHDLSYKQQEGFRYSARDLAVLRGKMQQLPVILGSATPSLESLYNVNQQRYQPLQLSYRVANATMPTMKIVDVRNQPLMGGVSPQLLTAIQTHLEQGNQVLIFLNRRGFAPAIICYQCGWVASCHHCDSRLVFHQQRNLLRCHHCGYTCSYINHCPECNSIEINPVGQGTERLETVLANQFPQHNIARVDRDTTRHKKALQTLLQTINRGDSQILIGTQMLAKGHHFPNVTLVAIINIDGGFFSADFRAIERVAQLIMQVAGRAGRADKSGEVFIQSHQPDNPLLLNLVNHGYHHFAQAILQERQICQLPPFSYFALFRAESQTLAHAEKFLEQIKQLAKPFHQESNIELCGPVPAPMQRCSGRFRAQLLVQTIQRQTLHQLLTHLLTHIEKIKTPRQLRWSIDVDPVEML
ncbi:MAG: primosomal protein N' [Gammaproteobacteria bacterium]|nr:primosomal protein N' [Gammaproteobacteria bacterium]